jgi:hypothetical protein
MKPPRSWHSARAETQEVIAPVQEESTPKDAYASTPAKLGSTRHEQEEALRRFNDASRAFYLLVDTGRPELLARIGELMDAQARRLS